MYGQRATGALLLGMLGDGVTTRLGLLKWSRFLVRTKHDGSEADEGGVDLAHAGQR